MGAAAFLEYAAREYQRGLEDGRGNATAISLGESNYGATQSAIVAVPFNGMRDLINQITGRRWRRGGDNPGQAYMGTCELVLIHHTDYSKIALLKCATHYDI